MVILINPLHHSSYRVVFSENRDIIDKTVNNIIEWLKTGSSDAKRPIDWDWDVEIIEKDDDHILLEAFHPKAYLKLVILVKYDQYLIKMAVNPLYPTKFLDNKDRIILYYYLLKANLNLPLAKVSLFGEDDEVLFLVDLDARTLGKEEFNHALEALYYSVIAFAKALEIQDEVINKYYENVSEALMDRLAKGEKPEQLVEYLIVKAGLPRDKAEEIVKETLYLMKKEAERRKTEETTLIM